MCGGGSVYLNDHLCSPSRDHVNAFARSALRNHQNGKSNPPSSCMPLEVIMGGSVYLNDHLCSPSRDRVNQHVCKKCTKEPPKRNRHACLTRGNCGG